MKQENNSCPFCEKLAKLKDDAEYYRRPGDTSVNTYSVALVQNTFYGDIPTGKLTNYGYDLNFCPVCGKKMKN